MLRQGLLQERTKTRHKLASPPGAADASIIQHDRQDEADQRF